MSEITVAEIKKLTKVQSYFRGYKDGESDTLDKIRAEIVGLRSRQNVGVLECLDVIDKHKSENRRR